MKSTEDKIRDLEEEIAQHRARMKEIIDAAEEDEEKQGELDEEEQKELDEEEEMKAKKQARVDRLKSILGAEKTAKPVSREPSTKARAPREPAQPKAQQEKGLGFARMVMCFAAAKGNPMHAMEIARSRYPHEKGIQTYLKAQIPGGTSVDPTWAEPLVYPENLVSEFVEFLRPRTIIGRFGDGTIPSLRRVPFNVRMPTQTSGGDGYWVGEGKPKPLTKFDFGSITLRWTKVAGIAVITEDLLRFSAPSAEVVVRQSLSDALVARLDSDFANPSITEQADVRPGAITAGATTVAASGVTADDVRNDIRLAAAHFIANNIPLTGVVVLMRDSQAVSLALMRNALGQREFPDMTMTGGMLEGFPVLASQFMPSGIVAFVSADNVYLADDGGVAVDMSREASLEMADDPTNEVNDGSSPPVSVEATLVSMFQTNSVAIRAERFINWKRRRSAAVYYLTGTGWGAPDTSPPTVI